MNDDFYHTALRMWTDANILYRSEAKKSWFNTCYLVGYVLECYGKLLLVLAVITNGTRYIVINMAMDHGMLKQSQTVT